MKEGHVLEHTRSERHVGGRSLSLTLGNTCPRGQDGGGSHVPDAPEQVAATLPSLVPGPAAQGFPGLGDAPSGGAVGQREQDTESGRRPGTRLGRPPDQPGDEGWALGREQAECRDPAARGTGRDRGAAWRVQGDPGESRWVTGCLAPQKALEGFGAASRAHAFEGPLFKEGARRRCGAATRPRGSWRTGRAGRGGQPGSVSGHAWRCRPSGTHPQ